MDQTPDLPSIEHWPLAKFQRYERNPRKHAPERIRQFADAIKRFGFRVPLLARSTGELVDGHFRLKAAELLQLETVPVILVDDMTPAQVREFRLSINRMPELAEWDQDNLLHELENIEAAGLHLEETGPIGFELEEFNPELDVEPWDLSPTKDSYVITLTGSLPFEAEVRERLKGLVGVKVEVSTLQRS